MENRSTTGILILMIALTVLAAGIVGIAVFLYVARRPTIEILPAKDCTATLSKYSNDTKRVIATVEQGRSVPLKVSVDANRMYLIDYQRVGPSDEGSQGETRRFLQSKESWTFDLQRQCEQMTVSAAPPPTTAEIRRTPPPRNGDRAPKEARRPRRPPPPEPETPPEIELPAFEKDDAPEPPPVAVEKQEPPKTNERPYTEVAAGDPCPEGFRPFDEETVVFRVNGEIHRKKSFKGAFCIKVGAEYRTPYTTEFQVMR